MRWGVEMVVFLAVGIMVVMCVGGVAHLRVPSRVSLCPLDKNWFAAAIKWRKRIR